MKAVQLTTSGDYFPHYHIDDPEEWSRDIQMHEGLSLERLEDRDVSVPEPGPGQVLVEVGAAASTTWRCGPSNRPPPTADRSPGPQAPTSPVP